ncbi:ATP-binding cassette, subfamily C, CydC [Desulfonatronum thiosulfatophilum]|uniref:ATP-binding cassette, subfamily C, CydC n=1 Tax=Desulfonatronum thiosulfatophilum TaxID=617002 RepID=A0A1G6AI66_9BACT|nr:thiol reductant ABC exporter subunit CydC [Desulfonatronum thiosulfatophilum]SDB08075.1 ATP-binding cassette, subfamily C, CydC [Desulfonatronum thiosulfatophilum]
MNGPGAGNAREFRMLLSMARAKWPWLLLGMACSVVTVLANMALLTVAAWFLASMALAGASGTLFNYFLPAATIRSLAIVRTIGRYAERLLTHDATLRLLADLRVRFFERLAPLVPAGLGKMHSADLFSRLRADIDLLDNFYLRLLLPAGAAICVAACGFVFLLAFDLGLALGVAGLWLSAGALLPWICLRLGDEPGAGQVRAASRMRCLVVDGLRGMEELMVYGGQARHRALVQEENDRLIGHQRRSARLESFAQGAVGLASGLAMWLVLVIGMPLIADGAWSPASLPMLAVLALVSFEAIQPLPGAWRMWGQIRVAAARILDITEARPPVREPVDPAIMGRESDLEIRNLAFTYPGRTETVLRNVHLRLPQGRRAGIVGAAGSGKTTLQQILLRFWEYDQGEIFLGGRELRTCAGEDVRARMAVVSQHVFLFNASIADNLRLGNPRASDAQLLEAARTARLEEFIVSLPEGLQSQVGQFGARLSGGQARRLSVARALLKDAPILILDEPTEGLDAATESAFWQALEPVMRGRTVLLITHRPAGLEYMDVVHRLDQGELLPAGAPLHHL